jgi:hypothetical protein
MAKVHAVFLEKLSTACGEDETEKRANLPLQLN